MRHLTRSCTFEKIDAATLAVVATIPVADVPTDVAVSPDGSRVWVTAVDADAMTVIDAPKTISLIPANSALSASFSVQMASFISGTPEVDLILVVTAPTSGKTASSIAISRHQLDVDEESLFYSTDFPTGCARSSA